MPDDAHAKLLADLMRLLVHADAIAVVHRQRSETRQHAEQPRPLLLGCTVLRARDANVLSHVTYTLQSPSRLVPNHNTR